MRYGAGRKEETRAKILKAAGRIFRRHGYHASGVDRVMEEAGLTAGGFYAHFASKEALFAEVLGPAAVDAAAQRADHEAAANRAWVEAFLENYLSASHRDNPEEGCPLPALLSEIARATGPVKANFEAIIRSLAGRIERTAGGKEDRALAVVALCIGGLGVARSVEDDAFGERILSACRDLAEHALADSGDRPQSAKRRNTRDVF